MTCPYYASVIVGGKKTIQSPDFKVLYYKGDIYWSGYKLMGGLVLRKAIWMSCVSG